MTLNLGTGMGHSVLEIVKTFEKVSGRSIPLEFSKRRKGDVASCYADPALAIKEIKWKAKLGISDICKDSWNFQTRYDDSLDKNGKM